jgi:transcriptional regulator with XRE-family HTH domain
VLPQRALGRAIREIRRGDELSQEALGLRVGLHRNYVGYIEVGRVNPTWRTVLRLTAGLGVSLRELVEVYERQVADGSQGR